MPMIIAAGKCEDGARWEKGFRSHSDLFRLQTVTSPIKFTVNESNFFAILFEVDDVEKFQEILESEATADAMVSDGVIRETIKVHLLDRELDLKTAIQ